MTEHATTLGTANNSARIIATAMDRMPAECAAGRGKALLMDLHAALARNAAERLILAHPERFNEEGLAALVADALNTIDELIQTAVATYATIGVAPDDLILETAETIDRSFRKRFTEVAFATMLGGRA